MTKETYLGPRTRAHLESGPIGPYLDRLAEILHITGYQPAGIRSRIRAADKFGRWLKDHDLT
jgi:hypothetical protein